MAGRYLYTAALRLATPVILGRLLWRSRRAPDYRRRWGERFGFVSPVEGGPIWVHAVSVGETVAAAPLIRDLLARYPQTPILLTNTTPTGSERTRGLFGERVHHCYLPYDTPGALRRFLDRVRPRLGIVMETEIWPNLMYAVHARGIPVVLANARLSARSARGYAHVRSLAADALARFTLIAAQTQTDADRFTALGAPADRVTVTGSIKFDQGIAQIMVEAGEALRREVGEERPVWVAASTHEGEDEIVLAAHRRVLLEHPSALLIIVPRHPERFDTVARRIEAAGLSFVRRTGRDATAATAQVYLADTMGELQLFLVASDIAFVGGSLVASGGHNLLEPAGLAKPVLTGPHMFNFAEIDRMLETAGGLRRVHGEEDVATAVSELFADPDARARLGAAAEAVVAANRGAKERLLAALDHLLDSSAGTVAGFGG